MPTDIVGGEKAVDPSRITHLNEYVTLTLAI